MLEIWTTTDCDQRNRDIITHWREIQRRNSDIHRIPVGVNSGGEAFLPRILVNAGLFPSTSEVKRNRPDLWREVDVNESITFRLGWADVTVDRLF